jgi:CDP-diacylglycerol--serine O-phosphatidyltransferase
VLGILFLSNIRVPKPTLKGILIMVAIGAAEGILLIIGMFLLSHIRY